MRRYIGVLLLLVVSLFAVALPSTEGETIRVPQDYPTLAAAIATAPPGSMIIVAAGIYREENLVIDKDLTIVGEDRMAVALLPPEREASSENGEDDDEEGEDPPIITVRNGARFSLSGVTLFGFKGAFLFIINRVPAGIMVTEGSKLILEDSLIFIFDVGLLIKDASTVEMRNTVFLLNGSGVQLEDEAQARVSYSSFNGDEIGIRVGDEARLDLDNTIFQGSSLGFKGSAKGTITGTRFHGAGIGIEDKAWVVIEESEVEGAETGVHLQDGAILELHNSRFSDCEVGIRVKDHGSLTMEGCEISENDTGIGVRGFFTDDFPEIEIRRSRIVGNTVGIELGGNGEATIEGNEIVGNAGCGLQFRWAPVNFQVRGSGNSMRGNGMDLCGPFPAELRLPLVPQGEETTLRVPDDYPTIQEAIDALAPGGTVELAPGEYHQGVLLWKPLTLRGAEGASLDAIAPYSPMIVVLPEATVQIEGLGIGGTTGLQVWGRATVTGCNFSSILEIGVHSGTAQVIESTFTGHFYGIIADEGSKLTVVGSTFTIHEKSIEVYDSEAELKGNTISGGNGVWLAGSTATIHDNKIMDCGTGITLLKGSEAQIAGNTITGCSQGIFAESQTQSTIEGNHLVGNRVGVFLWGSARATIRANEITGSTRAGILLDKRVEVEIFGNKIVGNEGWGIATWTKECFPEDDDARAEFLGEVRGGDNEVHDNDRGDLCGVPSDLKELKASPERRGSPPSSAE